MCSRENQRLAEYCNPNLRVLKRSSKLGKQLSQAPRDWLKECGRLAPRNALVIAKIIHPFLAVLPLVGTFTPYTRPSPIHCPR